MSAIEEIEVVGFEVVVICVKPSTESNNPQFPTFGSMEERNMCSILFNENLERRFAERGVAFISLFKYLINRNLKSKTEYYFDGVHLGQLGMPFAMKGFKKVVPVLFRANVSKFEIYFRIVIAKIFAYLKFINRKRL